MRTAGWKELLHVKDVRSLLTGALILASAIVFATILAAYLLSHGLLEPRFRLFAVYQDGTGMIRGAKVLLNGVQIGVVEQVELGPDARPVLELSIHRRYRELLRLDSRAYFKRDRNVVSDRVLNIEMGRDPRMLSPGDTLQLSDPEDLETALNSVAGLAVQLQSTLNRVDSLLSMASDTSTTIGALLVKDDLYRRTLATVENVDRIARMGTTGVERLNSIGGQLDRDLPLLLRRSDSLGASLVSSARRADTLSRLGVDLLQRGQDLSNQAASLGARSSDLLDRGDRLMDGLSRSWFLRGYFQPRREPSDRLPLDVQP